MWGVVLLHYSGVSNHQQSGCLSNSVLEIPTKLNWSSVLPTSVSETWRWWGRGWFKKHELLNLRALKFLRVNEMHIFQCMGKIFCVEFQRAPHTLKDTFLCNIEILRAFRFKNSYAFLKRPSGGTKDKKCGKPSHVMVVEIFLFHYTRARVLLCNL